jgi:hypothetical protein
VPDIFGYAPPTQATTSTPDLSGFGDWKRAQQLEYLTNTYGDLKTRAKQNETNPLRQGGKFLANVTQDAAWMSPEEKKLWAQVNPDAGTWLGNAFSEAAPYALAAGLAYAGGTALMNGMAPAAAPAGTGTLAGSGAAATTGGLTTNAGLGAFANGGAAGLGSVGGGNAGLLASSGAIAGGAGATGGGLLGTLASRGGTIGRNTGLTDQAQGAVLGEQPQGAALPQMAPMNAAGMPVNQFMLAQMQRNKRAQELRQKRNRTPEEDAELKALTNPGLLNA